MREDNVKLLDTVADISNVGQQLDIFFLISLSSSLTSLWVWVAGQQPRANFYVPPRSSSCFLWPHCFGCSFSAD